MAKKKSSKIGVALAYLNATGCTPYEAAKHAGMHPSPVYARLRRDKARSGGVCPCCGQEIGKASPAG